MMVKTIIAAVVIASAGHSIGAATFTATSTGVAGGFSYSDFTINFDDANGNGLLDLNEITAFSGTRALLGGTRPFGGVLNTVEAIPSLAGMSNGGASWVFSPNGGSSSILPRTRWTYSINNIEPIAPSAVPLPAGLGLLLSGMAILGLCARRNS